MSELGFDVDLRWSGTGRDGIGELQGDDLAIDISVPSSMGGRGVGSNPEELLTSAVASCYTATLFGVLQRRRLPVESLAVRARGVMSGFPGRARFDRLTVCPTILGGDEERREEYDEAANAAHDRCLIGRSLAPSVSYVVGAVTVRAQTLPALT